MKYEVGRLSVSNAGNPREDDMPGRRYKLKTTRKKHVPQEVSPDPLGNRAQRRAAARLGIKKVVPVDTVDDTAEPTPEE